MRTAQVLLIAVVIIGFIATTAFLCKTTGSTAPAPTPPRGCVFKTVFGEESLDSGLIVKSPAEVVSSMDRGLQWMVKAQQPDGGWGAGSHDRQNEMDPHAVKTDPATTSMVAMALLRKGTTLTSGEYASILNKALNYILRSVETSTSNSTNITTVTNTQIQTKLGANIDVILSSQFLSNILDYTDHNEALKARTKKCLDLCVQKIQKLQDNNGSFRGSGWAGVLQSSLANNALESAQSKGAKVDTVVLEKSKNFQQSNFDVKSGSVNTTLGAGVVLYSVSSSTRASAKDAGKVEEQIVKAKKEGKWSKDDQVTSESLQKIGFNKTDAMKYSTSYNVYQSAKMVAQDNRVMEGFGNNGGEEFLSYLQTGESMIIGRDESWKKWYDSMSARLVSIQNNDGSWNGHHCITSPVFCTATCLLILSVNNDVEKLVKMSGH